jgi:Family of unknown function (DUF6049)
VSRGRALLTVFGLISTSFVALLPTAVEAAQDDLQLVAQNFNLAADGSLTATIALPSRLVDTDLSTALFAITVAERVNKREDLAPIITGALSHPDDTVVISPLCCPGPLPGQFTFSIPLEVAEVRPDALSIPRTGLYPVTIALQRDGRILSTVLTFIDRLPSADEGAADADQLSVAVAVATSSAVHLDSKGTTSVDNESTVDEMTSLADTLDVLEANKMPATVRVAPAVLGALQGLNPTLFARLIASLQSHQVEVEPQWPIDPSSAASDGQNSLYTSWLRDGQGRLAGLGLGPSILTPSTIIVDKPIGAAGAVLRYNLGAELMVTTPQIYDTLGGTISKYSDYKGELVPARLPNNATLDVAVVDRIISDLFVHPAATPELTRIYAVANLLALRQGVAILGESPSRRAVVLAMPDLSVPEASAIGPLTALIAETPGLTAATLDDVAFRTDRLVIDGDEKPVTLPTVDDKTLASRIFRQAKLNNEIDAVSSMLPADNDRPKGWRDLADLLPTTALDDADAAALDETVRGELDEIRSAVQLPPAYTVNLPGKRSTVRVRFLNNSDVPLQIKVQLTSPSGKLVFNNDPQPVLLPPGVPVNVPINVEARSNGTSGVSLDVFTPNDVRLGDTVPLKFRVKALGVGNVLTIALFGLVLLWWLQHMVSAWRKRRQSRPATLPVS